LERSNRELNYQNNKKYELENKISVLENFIENGGSLSHSVKSVLNNPRLNGVHDCIGNLVDCDIKFSKALDVALGASKQFLVVDTEQTAKEAIEYLKSNKLGRATFFPLNVIQAKGIDLETEKILKQEMGYIDTLASLVRYDEKYRNIIYNQLGNVLVVLDLDNANRISKRINNRYRIVTLDGEIIHVGGSITGGNVNNSRSMITDKYELEKLVRNKQEQQTVISELETSISSLEKNLTELENKLYIKKNEQLSLQEKINNKNITLRDFQETKDKIVNEYQSLEHVVDSSLSKEEERLMNAYYEAQKAKEETKVLVQRYEKGKEKFGNYLYYYKLLTCYKL